MSRTAPSDEHGGELTKPHPRGHAPAPGRHHVAQAVDKAHVHKTHYSYGWNPDVPDPRDHILVYDSTLTLPDKVDLRPQFTAYNIPIYDQGSLNSCTATALATLVEYTRAKHALPPLRISRLALYHGQRGKDGTMQTDSGGQLRNGLVVLDKRGACDELAWPYEAVVAEDGCFPAGSRTLLCPDVRAYRPVLDGLPFKYCRVLQVKDNMRGCLAQGYPFVVGFQVLGSFEKLELAMTDSVSVPPAGSHSKPIGGHAVVVVGYDEEEQCFICRNSRGADWGDKGHFKMPYSYLCDADLAGDLWTVRTVQSSVTRKD